MKNALIGTRHGRRAAQFSRTDTRAMTDGPGWCQTTTGGVTRRTALLGLATSFSIGRATLAMASAPTDKRPVVIILRGALDGMAAVVPYGDRSLAALRGEIVPPGPGQANGLLDLGGFYGLHPALTGLHEMYSANEALAVHAVAGSYRVRSHFEAQDYLESGADHRMTSGWLNRAVASLPAAETARPGGEALAVGVSVPLLLRGQAVVANWAPHGFSEPSPDLYATIAALNKSDPIPVRRSLKVCELVVSAPL